MLRRSLLNQTDATYANPTVREPVPSDSVTPDSSFSPAVLWPAAREDWNSSDIEFASDLLHDIVVLRVCATGRITHSRGYVVASNEQIALIILKPYSKGEFVRRELGATHHLFDFPAIETAAESLVGCTCLSQECFRVLGIDLRVEEYQWIRSPVVLGCPSVITSGQGIKESDKHPFS